MIDHIHKLSSIHCCANGGHAEAWILESSQNQAAWEERLGAGSSTHVNRVIEAGIRSRSTSWILTAPPPPAVTRRVARLSAKDIHYKGLLIQTLFLFRQGPQVCSRVPRNKCMIMRSQSNCLCNFLYIHVFIYRNGHNPPPTNHQQANTNKNQPTQTVEADGQAGFAPCRTSTEIVWFELTMWTKKKNEN